MLFDSQNPAQSERLLRSMHWLRRSFLATDPFLEFSALAFGLEARAALLPGAKGGRPSTSERLRSFAITVPRITELRWKQVGGLRHTLFYGGITDVQGRVIGYIDKVPIPIEDKRLVDQPWAKGRIIVEHRVPAADEILGTSITWPPAGQPRRRLHTGLRRGTAAQEAEGGK
jgi:hypothetical protein